MYARSLVRFFLHSLFPANYILTRKPTSIITRLTTISTTQIKILELISNLSLQSHFIILEYKLIYLLMCLCWVCLSVGV